MSRQIRIEALLRDALAPLHLEISDDSAQHNVPPGDVSHLRLLLVSERFAGVKALDRHRRIATNSPTDCTRCRFTPGRQKNGLKKAAARHPLRRRAKVALPLRLNRECIAS